MPLILASASPRRIQLLEQIGIRASALAANVDERVRPGESAEALARRLARAKASALNGESLAGHRVLGADTIVAIDDQILGKPRDRADGVGMLMRLQGREHRVLTGVCLIEPNAVSREILVETRVRFGTVEQHEAEAYWVSGEPIGKAGGYAIQGLGARFVEHLSGSYSNVVGLPLYETARLLDGRSRTRDE